MCDFALIGNPVEKSLSPLMQNAMLKALGRKEVYTKYQVSPDMLENWLKTEEAKKLKGFNVTMPLKQEIMPYLVEIAENAKNIKAINTVVRKENKLYGYNTDSIGFVQALREKRRDISSKNIALEKIAILGSGGGAYAVAEGLLPLCKNIKVYCRKIEERHFAKEIEMRDFSRLESDNDFKENTLIINATPLGMYGYNNFDSLSFLKELKKETLVCDLIYKPNETLLLKKAREQGLETMNGLNMLIYQGIAALELFLEIELDKVYMEKVARKAIEEALAE